jgi:nucleoside-diphosphate-sugar epimerase
MEVKNSIISPDSTVLVTGSTGFIGRAVVANLLERGCAKIRCFSRCSSDRRGLDAVISKHPGSAEVEFLTGNLLSRQDCLRAARGVAVIYHLAMGTSLKSVPHTFLNSVVTTRNLLDASIQCGSVKRFVNMSSFVVYTNRDKPKARLLDESCPFEDQPLRRGDAYTYAKVKQDELVMEYGRKHGLPYVLLRPGVVYGPGKNALTGRVGIDTFGFFLHMGGSNAIPLTYIDNCADAVVLAGLTPGIDGQVFNIVDDDLPSSRQMLRQYKKNVRPFPSIYMPHAASYLLCYLWEKYSAWSNGQLPPAFSRWGWHAFWKRTTYSNQKLKELLAWKPRVPTETGLARYFEACRNGGRHA